MKVALLLIASLVACKPSSSAKPAEGSAAPAPAAHERARGPAPTLPTEQQQGSGEAAEPQKPPPWLDKNGDGVVTAEEREQAKADREARMRDRFDVNHDGKLTPDELAAAGSGMGGRGPRFTDPKALDTNNDGEISPDELRAGMIELRKQRHQREMIETGD